MQKPNKIERYKAELPPADFELESVDWAHPDERIRFYLKNYGIYNIKLRPENWMIRLRFDGGKLSPYLASQIAEIAEEEGLRILLTARSQIELHNIPPGRVHPLWLRLNAQGGHTSQTLTDNVRGIVTDPLSDCAPDAHIDTFPIIASLRETFLEREEWIGTLPRKFNTALIGRETPSLNPWGNDLLFALAEKEGRWGFNLYLGGKNSETAKDADIFCLPEETAALFTAVIKSYRRHGPRGSRSKTRLFHLIEDIGMQELRRLIETEYGQTLQKAGSLRMKSSIHNTDYHLPIRRYGRHGETAADSLKQAAEEAKEQNKELRLTPHQQLWLFDPKEIQSSSSFHDSQFSILNSQSASGGSVTACAGLRYCPLSLWDIKEDLKLLPMRRFEKLGISLGFSGCLKGCGRHYHSDLGLIGLRTNLYGETERAARIFLGALQSPDPAPARLLYYSVPLRKLDNLIHTILDDYEASGLESFEEFSRKVLTAYSTDFLQLWYLLRQLYHLNETIKEEFQKGSEEKLLKNFKKLDKYPESDELYEIVRELSHRLWDRTVRS